MKNNRIEEDSQIVQDFVFEFLENLDRLEVSLIELEQDPADIETMDIIFRAFHSMKALSAFLQLDPINRLTHSAENLLAKTRKGQVPIDRKIVDIILDAVDMLRQMSDGIRTSLEMDDRLFKEIDPKPLIDRLDAIEGDVNLITEKPLGEILVSRGAVSHEAVEAGLARQKADPRKKLGHILVEGKMARTKEVILALRDQKAEKRYYADLQVKVDTKKIDRIIDLTTQLKGCLDMLCRDAWIRPDKKLKPVDVLPRLGQLSCQLHRTALSVRRVSLDITFQRMVRLVRDLSNRLGKEIVLKLAGGDMEIDYAVAGELYEPLVHMIRNAIDHGIEMPEERERSGKDRIGTILLEAYHEGNNVIVAISDDGRGLQEEEIIEKAERHGFITKGCEMSKAEINQIIFQPGFSTASKVTALSGRGVGMDVAKKVIENFGGRLDVQSWPGRGSTFRIQIPHTIDILKSYPIAAGEDRSDASKWKEEVV